MARLDFQPSGGVPTLEAPPEGSSVALPPGFEVEETLGAPPDPTPDDFMEPAASTEPQAAPPAGPIFPGPSALDIQSAFVAAAAAHSDFRALQPAIEIIFGVFCPDWSRITAAEYLESCYVIARHAGFAMPARARLLAAMPGWDMPVPNGFVN